MFISLLFLVFPTVYGTYACNECFCYEQLGHVASSDYHSYDQNVEKFYYGNAVCQALKPGDYCYPKVYTSHEACKAACKRFLDLAEVWKNFPMTD